MESTVVINAKRAAAQLANLLVVQQPLSIKSLSIM